MDIILKIWPKWVQSGSNVRMSRVHIHPNLIKIYFQYSDSCSFSVQLLLHELLKGHNTQHSGHTGQHFSK